MNRGRFQPLARLPMSFLLSVVGLLSACAPTHKILPPGEVPRAQVVSAKDEEFGHEVLSGLSDQYKLDRDDARINRVRDVVARLTAAANANQDPWHVYVFNDDGFKNAAATRGNYVFVWTGILNTVKDDDELATILAHEIGHVLAGHTTPSPVEEQRQMMAGAAGSIANEALSVSGQSALGGLAEALVKLSMEALLVNPDLQAKELEADQIGLFLMADAGFDPDKGVRFWERVKTDPEFSGFPIQFLSSHPSSEERFKRLAGLLPLARERFSGGHSSADYKYAKGEVGREDFRLHGKAARPLNETWVVVEERVRVFERPANGSAVTTTLRVGERVQVVARVGPWLQITAPARGYVSGIDLAPFVTKTNDAGFAQ